MISQGADPAYSNAASFSAYLKNEMGRWGGAVKKAGVKLG